MNIENKATELNEVDLDQVTGGLLIDHPDDPKEKRKMIDSDDIMMNRGKQGPTADDRKADGIFGPVTRE